MEEMKIILEETEKMKVLKQQQKEKEREHDIITSREFAKKLEE